METPEVIDSLLQSVCQAVDVPHEYRLQAWFNFGQYQIKIRNDKDGAIRSLALAVQIGINNKLYSISFKYACEALCDLYKDANRVKYEEMKNLADRYKLPAATCLRTSDETPEYSYKRLRYVFSINAIILSGYKKDNHMRIVYRGKQFDFSRTFKDCKIQKDDTVTYILKLRGD